MQAAKSPAVTAAVGAALASGPAAATSVGIALGPVGWSALGLLAGASLAAGWYYSQSQGTAIVAATSGPGSIAVPGYTLPSQGHSFTLQACPGGANCQSGFNQVITMSTPSNSAGWGTLPTGWFNMGVIGGDTTTWIWGAKHDPAHPETLATSILGSAPTASTIASYLAGLPSSDPNSLDSARTAWTQAQGNLAPNQSTVSISPSDLATTVVPATSVQPTDLVLDPNAPPATTPQVAVTPQNTTSTTTTTTTTTSGNTTTTTQTDTPGAFSCGAGNHDARTMGTILSDHMNTWKTVGIGGTLNNLKNIVWPTTIPVYSIGPTQLGTFNINFNSYAWAFADLRLIVIAFAAIYGVVIVFRGRAAS